MTDIAIRRLEFARGEGEALATGRVRLDAPRPMRRSPECRLRPAAGRPLGMDVIVEAAQLLGCTRHHLKRLIIKHRIEWPRGYKPRQEAP